MHSSILQHVKKRGEDSDLKEHEQEGLMLSDLSGISGGQNRAESEQCPVEMDAEEDGWLRAVELYAIDEKKRAFAFFCAVVTGGISLLFWHWFPVWWERKLKRRVASAAEASSAVVTDPDGTTAVARVRGGVGSANFFVEYRFVRFFRRDDGAWCPASFQARPLSVIVREARLGLKDEDVERRRALFGANLADVPMSPDWKLLVDEVLHPFIVFQVWSVFIWYIDEYTLYATVIVLLSVASVASSFISTRRNLRQVRDMARSECEVRVLRRSSEGRPPAIEVISSVLLVPGDTLILQPQTTLPCDVLFCVGGCVIDESMLTGESVPVIQTAIIPPEASKTGSKGVGAEDCYKSTRDARHTGFCGTKVLELRHDHLPSALPSDEFDTLTKGALEDIQGDPSQQQRVLAIVLRTGFQTAKGKLVRAIMFPKPSTFKFYSDSFKFVGMLAALAVFGFLFCIGTFVEYGVAVSQIIIRESLPL